MANSTENPVGGRFSFSPDVHLGPSVNSEPASNGEGPKPHALNIEVFSQTTVLGPLAPGFTQGVIINDTVTGDSAPRLIGSGVGNQILTGRQLTLFGGNYQVVDTTTVAGNSAVIQAGSGNQTIVGAKGDTLIGGTGNQSIVGTAGSNRIFVEGHGQDTVRGGAWTRIVSGSGAETITGGRHDHIAVGGAPTVAGAYGAAFSVQ